jgi:hypothetical protein
MGLALGEDIALEVEVAEKRHRLELIQQACVALKEKAIPLVERLAPQVAARVLLKMGCTEKLALQVVCPSMQGTDNRLRLASALEHDGLAVPADVREQLDAVALVHQNAAVVFMGERMEVALIGHHELVANIAGARCEAGLALLGKKRLVKVSPNRQLCSRRFEPRKGSDV